MHPFILLMVLIIANCNCGNVEKLVNETTSDDEVDGENSRKILGSSVVTSVSVIMDTDNGTKIYTDAVGHQLTKPLHASDVASPIELLNPDRYEFYTFDDNGDLVKRLMTWEEIQEIVANDGNGGDYALSLESPTNGVGGDLTPEKRVDDVVNNVHNVVQEEIANQKNQSYQQQPQFDTPDVSDNWSQILPAIFENSGEEISPKPTPAHATPDTIMVEPPMVDVKTVPPTTTTLSTTEKIITLAPSTVKTLPPSSAPTTTTTTTTTATSPSTTIEIVRTEASSTTTRLPIVELSKDNSRPIYHVPGTTTTRPTTTGTTTTSTAATTTTTTSAGTTTTSTTEPVPTTLPVKPQTTPITEKMSIAETVLPETTTVLTSTRMAEETTEQDLTTEPTLPVTTLLAILRRSTTTPLISTEIVTENDNFSTLSPPTTTETMDTITTNLPESTEFLKSQETTQPNTESSTSLEDLSTLATEYISMKFDKFLLTSTNIYEINAELAGSKTTTVLPTTTNEEETITDSTTTTTTQNVPTTENRLVESIEQLIGQAIATELVPPPAVVPAPIDNQDINQKIHDMIMNSSNKTMEIVQNETATVSSDLISNNFNVETTTEPGTTITTEVPPQSIDSVLGESLGSILSQVWGSTAEPATSLESTTVISTTTSTEYVPHIINITIIRNNENLKNQSKPAKADLSLEMEYEKIEEELKKNSSLLSLESVPEQMKIEYNTSTTTENVESATEFFSTTLEAITENTIQNDRPAVEPVVVVEINETVKNETEFNNSTTSTWTLVSTILPPISRMTTTTRQIQDESTTTTTTTRRPPPAPINLVYEPLQGSGLEDSTKQLDNDVNEFVQLCNELAFGFWKTVTATLSPTRSVVISPFAATSLLAMVFLGARGATSGEMNDILQLDDMVTFNPHLIFKNISESIKTNNNNTIDGVAISGIIRQLYSDRSKGKLLSFYKDRVRQFYDGHVEEVGFREIADIIRRRTNLLVRRTSDGTIAEFLKDSFIYARPPLAGISTSIFFSDCSSGSISTDNSDGELYFTVTPTLRERRLVPIPAAVWRGNFLAGYEPSLDATAAAIGTKFDTISTVFVMPGQPASVAADGLAMLEKHFVESSFKKGAWARLLRSLQPRNGLELQLPRFIHRSILNATHSFQRMGLHDLFDAKKADLRGLNGGAVHELHLSEMIQINEFGLCGENGPNNLHHREVYPAAVGRRSRSIEQFDDSLHDPSHLDLPLPLRPRQARFPKESDDNNNNGETVPRLRFDRPFLYFVRHNPSGIILHMGRFHPRLL